MGVWSVWPGHLPAQAELSRTANDSNAFDSHVKDAFSGNGPVRARTAASCTHAAFMTRKLRKSSQNHNNTVTSFPARCPQAAATPAYRLASWVAIAHTPGSVAVWIMSPSFEVRDRSRAGAVVSGAVVAQSRCMAYTYITRRHTLPGSLTPSLTPDIVGA